MIGLPEAVALSLFVSLALYLLLGGADFGGGMWDLFASGPRAQAQRHLIEQAITPVWEANHVWLILAIVLLFTGFPTAFSAIFIELHIPLTLLLLGIVIRGAAFVFRQYGGYEGRAHHILGLLFALSSTLSPFFLGVCLGAITSGSMHSDPESLTQHVFSSWAAFFPAMVGGLTLSLVAWVAGVYLANETEDPALQNDFRKRSLIALAATVVFAVWLAFLIRDSAPTFRDRFFHSPLAHALQIFAILGATLTAWALWKRSYRVARVLTVIEALLLWGVWGYAQFPYLIAPSLTIQKAAAPRVTLSYLILALGFGTLLLFPSLIWLIRIFKTERRIR